MNSWSDLEVELIIGSYFQMLSNELLGKGYSKASFRKSLLSLLNNRSEGSIEFKHQNISAVLINLGQPYIKGYLPRFNYQKILEEKVIDYLIQNKAIENQFKFFADKEILNPITNYEFEKLTVEAPSVKSLAESTPNYERSPIKINYLEREQKNIKLGFLGEKLALEYEKWNLIQIGKEKLAEEVKWVSQEEGDGIGFDILSKQKNGKDKYIEVKTTKMGKETTFFFTRNELLFSNNHSENYHLFRLFNFESNARLFIKNGGLDTICKSIPITFKGYF